MKKLFLLGFVLLSFSCSSSDGEIEVQSETQEEVEKKDDEKKDDEPQKEEVDINVVVPVGDVTNLSLYSGTPYRSDEAGYQGTAFVDLPDDRKLTFLHNNTVRDTRALSDMIDNLSALGGGEILIKKGDYELRQVNVKSNIHITIEAGTIFKIDNTIGGKRFPFAIGVEENKPIVENVRIIGLGTPSTRPKFVLEKFVQNGRKVFSRAMNFGYAKNVLVQNFTIEDDLTGGTAIAFNPVKIDVNSANIPENVTVTNVGMTGASIGYGLVQTNVGKNILFKNLSCEGGMTCRIEAHTGRQYDIGVTNIVIKNVVSKNGKAAVLLQPHSVLNGRVLVDVARSEGSSWVLFLKEGFIGPDSKRKAKGNFDASSSFKNISMLATDNTARLSFKNYSQIPIPTVLKKWYKTPDFNPVLNDDNYGITDDGELSKESSIIGPSVAIIYKNTTYPLNLPKEENLLLEGKTEGRLKILD